MSLRRHRCLASRDKKQENKNKKTMASINQNNFAGSVQLSTSEFNLLEGVSDNNPNFTPRLSASQGNVNMSSTLYLNLGKGSTEKSSQLMNCNSNNQNKNGDSSERRRYVAKRGGVGIDRREIPKHKSPNTSRGSPMEFSTPKSTDNNGHRSLSLPSQLQAEPIQHLMFHDSPQLHRDLSEQLNRHFLSQHQGFQLQLNDGYRQCGQPMGAVGGYMIADVKQTVSSVTKEVISSRKQRTMSGGSGKGNQSATISDQNKQIPTEFQNKTIGVTHHREDTELTTTSKSSRKDIKDSTTVPTTSIVSSTTMPTTLITTSSIMTTSMCFISVFTDIYVNNN